VRGREAGGVASGPAARDGDEAGTGGAAGWGIRALWNRQRVLRSRTQSGAAFSQGDGEPFIAGVCRLPAGDCREIPGRRHHPLGAGQPEFAYAESGGGTFWRGGWELAVEALHGALHAQARQLAESGGDRHQLVLAAMPRATPHRRYGFSATRNAGLESSRES